MSDQDFNADAGGSSGSDSFSEYSSKSWFERIIDSIKGIVIGLVLVIGSSVLMFWNEGNSAYTAAALSEGAGQVVALPSEKVDAANEGKLIHVAGATSAAQALRDPDFGFDAKGLKLDRKVELYQWKEEKKTETQKKLGGGEETVTRYTYSREWSDKAIDSSKFRNSAEHRNPPMPALASREIIASDAKLGAFALGANVIGKLAAKEKFDAPDSASGQARAKLGERAKVLQGSVYAGANPDQPAIGDARVSWTMLPLAPVSVVARQTQSTFSPWVARNGTEIMLAEPGVMDAAVMFKHGQDENRILTWILRAVGLLLMFIGFRVMLSLLEVLADVVPFIGNIIGAGASLVALLFTLSLAPIIIAIAWLYYRPVVAAGVIVVGGALAFGVRELMKRRVAAKASARGMAPLPPPPGSFLQGGSPLMPK